MRFRVFVLTTVLSGSCLAAACNGTQDRVTTPSAVEPAPGASSGGGERGPVPPAQPSPPASATCDAAKAHFALGRRADGALLERARLAAGAASARFLRPRQPITMEFLGSRLNLNLDEQDVVRSATCG